MLKQSMKKVLLVVLVMTMSLSLTACGNKKAISGDDFVSKMEDRGFYVVDCTEQYSDYEYIEEVYVAMSEDEEYQIEYYKISSNDDAQDFYNTNKTIFEGYKGDSSASLDKAAGSYAAYALTTDDSYYSITKIDNTVVYVSALSDYKSDIKDDLDKLGY